MQKYSSPLTVLCVDDNADNRLSVSMLLQQGGYRVLTAGTGREALALTQRADLVVLDVQLPDLSGFEVCRMIKADPTTALVPVVLLSGRFIRSEDMAVGLEGGGDVYLTKPADPLVLLGQVKALGRIRRAELALRDRTSQLEAANQEWEAFCHSVSHDLRAPLRTIDGFSQELLQNYSEKLDEQGKHYLQRVRAGSQRMAQLIDDLLHLCRLSRGELQCQRVDLSALAEAVAEDLKRQEPGRQMDVIIEAGLNAYCDPSLLRVVLENLLGNAWKFTSRHPRATIEFGRVENRGQMAFMIRDDGAGFNSTFASKLFGAFQRLHKEKDFPGTGIGLASVQRVIHRHGGTVWAEGAIENGAAFYFTLPERADV